jgi:hypothetical protein
MLHNRKIIQKPVRTGALAANRRKISTVVSVLLTTLSMQAAALGVNVSLSNKELHSRLETISNFTANQIR